MILVVDDAEDIRGLFGVWLKKDYEVKFAATGAEALALADTEPLPDLNLLDIELPDMDGYEICRRLKASPPLAAILVIFVTERNDPRDQARGLMSGAVDYITKPLSAPVMLLRVRTQLALESQIQKRTEELQETRARHKDELEGIHDPDFGAPPKK